MGRFDALTQLEERKDNKTPKELTDRIIVNRLDADAFSPPTTRQRGSTSTDKPRGGPKNLDSRISGISALM